MLKATTEQENAMCLFETGESLKINAFAGSGKTATLKLLADTSKRNGLYLAFNKTLAEEANSKFPYWVTCKTCHSIAYRSTPSCFKKSNEKMFGVMNSHKVAELFSFHKLNLPFRVSRILETLRNFLQSADDEITSKHVPDFGKLQTVSEEKLGEIRKEIINYTKRLWERMVDPDDCNVPLGHNGYFKLWALSNPQLPADYILLDEAQDTAPVMLGVLKKQHSQIVLVGDKYQQIYGWRGAVNAMEIFKTKNEATLTLSFRFGNSIAEAASKLLSSLGEEKTIRGNPNISSKLGCSTPEVILCRTNAGVIDYAIRCLNSDIIPHILGGNGELVKLLSAVEKLKRGEESDIPEFIGMTKWYDVVSFSKSEEGASLKTLVRIVERYGEDKLLSALSKTNSSECDAEIIISNVHRAKGRQWNKVVIVDDFGSTDISDSDNKMEMQLVYVALTRAREEVQLPFSISSTLGIKQDFHVMALKSA